MPAFDVLLAASPLDFSWIGSAESWIALLTLLVMEIVLGIDNIVFISILVDKLPAEQRARARFLGLGFAMLTRILLLFCITWVMQLKEPLFALFGHNISGKDLILILGGLFLLWKSTKELHHKVEGHHEEAHDASTGKAALGAILVQIAILDIVFSLDSVITAVGIADHIPIMVAAIVVAIIVMMVAAEPISKFVSDHPSTKMLALAFLVLIGVALVADGFEFHIPRGYVYFAITFSLAVETFNIMARKNRNRRA